MSIEQVEEYLAVTICFALFVCILVCQRQFRFRDIELIASAFLVGTEIPKAFLIFRYGFFPDPPGVTTKLAHLAHYVSLGGLMLLLVFLCALITLFVKAAAPLRHADRGSGVSAKPQKHIDQH